MTRKTNFFERLCWFKLNNLRLALGVTLKFYITVVKGLKLKVKNVSGLIITFVEVTVEKLVWEGRHGGRGGDFWSSHTE